MPPNDTSPRDHAPAGQITERSRGGLDGRRPKWRESSEGWKGFARRNVRAWARYARASCWRKQYVHRRKKRGLLRMGFQFLRERIRGQTHIHIVVDAACTFFCVMRAVIREMNGRGRFPVSIKAQMQVRPIARVHREKGDTQQSHKDAESGERADHEISIICLRLWLQPLDR